MARILILGATGNIASIVTSILAEEGRHQLRLSSTRDEAMGAVLIFADKSGAPIVEAGLLDDQAKAILASTADSRRVMLRCYCDGVNGRVMLKSCVAATK